MARTAAKQPKIPSPETPQAPQPPQPPKQRACGTMPVHERLLRTSPAYVQGRIASENFAHEVKEGQRGIGRMGVTVIPVVVHVVYNTASQNISDAQAKSQIDVLNRDYRRTNSDASSVPAPFKPLADDARVEFALATTDPGGAASNGITRTHTSATSFSDQDNIKSTATGGVAAWPADKYLNLWVAPRITSAQGDLLGYAQFPGGAAGTDGVVILHTAFGTVGTAAAPFNLGRTATHEIGHWLNLRHIWGDDGNGCSGSDFVADTPNQGNHNFGAPAFPHVTCNNGPNGDMFMNYMDYTDDVAMFMFTTGQVARMQACLDGDRSTIGHVKTGPTAAIQDLVGTTIASIDLGTTLAASDFPGTVSVLDHPTIAIVDVQPTIASLDHPPTLAQFDVLPTLAIQDVQPTLATLDHPPTLAQFDVQPTIATLDHPPTLAQFDVQPTLAIQDVQPTVASLDHPPTIARFDVQPTIAIRDVQPTIAQLDTLGGTLAFRDMQGTIGAADFPGQPGPFNPGDPSPFLLSTPHHSMAWTRSFPSMASSARASLLAQLQEIEAALGEYARADAAGQLTPLDVEQADRLYAEYMRMSGELQQYTHG